MNPDPVAIRALSEADIESVCALAGEIWHRHYPAIISRAQIEYMLEERYRPEVLRSELGQVGLWWDLLLVDNLPRGFSSCFVTREPGHMKLDKLYIHPDSQRAGHGKRLLERVLAHAREVDCGQLILAVNKRNANAIAAYRKWGFEIERSTVQAIGGGFVMDD